jgi:hypothetical protein
LRIGEIRMTGTWNSTAEQPGDESPTDKCDFRA